MAFSVTAVFGTVMVVIGGFLFKRGWWPRPVGDTPHCPKCDYILSGNQPRCSECGTVVDAKTVVRGERHRRLELAWIGGALSIFGIAMLMMIGFDLLYRVNWKRFEPLGWLVRDAGSNTSSWLEIQRRIDNRTVSEADQNNVVEKGLELRDAPASVYVNPGILDFVGNRFLEQKLTPAQADRFFKSMQKVALSVRPVVGSQSRLPYSLSVTGRGQTGWTCSERFLEYQIDDGPIKKLSNGDNNSTGAGYSSSSTGSVLPGVAAIGKHRLRVRLDLRVAQGSRAGWSDNTTFIRRVTPDLFADFEVVDGQTPIPTFTQPDASILRPLLAASVRYNSTYDPRLDPRPRLEVVVAYDPLPVDIAFRLVVRIKGREYPVMSHAISKGFKSSFSALTNDFRADPPPTIDVILRGTDAVARDSVDTQWKYWQGEIVIPNVPVERLAPLPSAAAQPGPTSGP